jgi:hypothetical protein
LRGLLPLRGKDECSGTLLCITIKTTDSEAAETLKIGIPEFIIKELDLSEKISTQGDWIQNRNSE